MLFSIIKWSDIIVHFNILYSKTELKTNLKKMGQISAKCGVVCERGNNISWYYAVVNVNIDLNVSHSFTFGLKSDAIKRRKRDNFRDISGIISEIF